MLKKISTLYISNTGIKNGTHSCSELPLMIDALRVTETFNIGRDFYIDLLAHACPKVGLTWIEHDVVNSLKRHYKQEYQNR